MLFIWCIDMDKKYRIGKYMKHTVGTEEYFSYVPVDLPFSPALDTGAIEGVLHKPI